MAFDAHKNFGVSLVATAPSPATSGTSLVVTAGEGTRFPATPFNAVVAPNAVPTPANAEVVRVTNRSTDTLTIARAQESSVARAIQAGDRIFAAITAKTLTDIETAFAPTTGTHAARLAAAHVANRLWKETDTGLIYLDDGTNWIIWKGDGAVVKTADETVNNSAVLQNDDHLLFPIEANEIWFVEAFLQLNAPSANSDFKIGWTGPAGASASWGLVTNRGEAIAPGGTWLAAGVAQGESVMVTLADSVAFGANNGTFGAMVTGTFTAAGTAGNIQFQWAQNTATVENSKVLKNSLMRIRRLA